MPTVVPFHMTPRLRLDIGDFHRRWESRRKRFRRQVGAPWWGSGLVITPDIRAQYERYLPIALFCHELASIAARGLPHPSWVPRMLRTRHIHTRAGLEAETPLSLPDLWACLPPHVAERPIPDADSLPVFLCALADPAAFGTNLARYPNQLSRLVETMTRAHGAADRCVLLDLGCGVGHGTLEAVEALHKAGLKQVRAIGCTREPLEAWMATARILPHATDGKRNLDALQTDLPVQFMAGDIRHIPLRRTADVVLCNGLIGGPYIDDEADFSGILGGLKKCLSWTGVLFAANRFHSGRRSAVRAFVQAALTNGWRVKGCWQNLILAPSPQPSTR